MSLFSFPALVNERAARIVAATVATSLVASLAFHQTWIVPALAVGFLLRVGWGPKVSPLARTAVKVADRLGEPKLVAGSPKRFAQGIGAACPISATALYAVGAVVAANVVVGMVIVFALLEATIAFCMGCWISSQLQRAGLVSPSVCIACAPRSLRPEP